VSDEAISSAFENRMLRGFAHLPRTVCHLHCIRSAVHTCPGGRCQGVSCGVCERRQGSALAMT
jgi:hypothetical protein